jgi:hypothetical protein
MMTRNALGFAALLVLAAGTAGAAGAELVGDPKTVIELFTSQGCPFSPDADRVVSELARQGDVIALNYHVDYWDYGGWKDTFGNPAYADLQRGYAELWGHRKLFTPQLVVGGRIGVLGSDVRSATRAIEANELTRPVELAAAGETLRIVVPEQAGTNPSTVWLVTYIEQALVDIGTGENAGKTLSYDHIVTSRTPLASLEAGMGTQLVLELERILREPASGLVVLVQENAGGMPGPITGADSFEH